MVPSSRTSFATVTVVVPSHPSAPVPVGEGRRRGDLAPAHCGWPCGRVRVLAPMPPVGERKVLELKCLAAAVQVDKELFEKVAQKTGLDAIEIVLTLPAVAHQAGHAEKSEMGADGRLSLAEDAAQSGTVHPPLVRQCQEDFEPRFIGELLEDSGQARQRSS